MSDMCAAVLILRDAAQTYVVRCKLPAGHDGPHMQIGVTADDIYGISWRPHDADQPQRKPRHDDA